MGAGGCVILISVELWSEGMNPELPGYDLTLTAAPGTESATARPLSGSIGHYRLLRLVGEGGMGAVYEAEQDHPRRIVALKVIKSGFATPALLRRFEQEAQALARLQHPGIAQIYEAGAADTGFGPQPYFAMEFIRGASLLEYAAARHLGLRERLELMARICDAVHHAHQRGLIHRDLKPGNILVDETGQPKILDFGVARVTDSDSQATRQTDMGQLIGTLAYMSPEQVLADPLELDTRSDVYALGVILYELIAGRLPYTLSPRLHEALQTIREQDPPLLSTMRRDCRGDIETIVAKALEKEKGRRYASAAGLAADIHRFLQDEPITARPATTAYQLKKFARRHKALVTGIAAVFVALVLGLGASIWQAVRAGRAERTALELRDRAVTAQETANAVNEFLQSDLLAQASADNQATALNKPDPDLKVRTALDRAAERISGKFGGKPLVEASIRETLANTYGDLGLYAEAERQGRESLDLRRRYLGAEHLDTLKTMRELGSVYRRMGRSSEAEALLRTALDTDRRALGEQHPETIEAKNSLALVYDDEGKFALGEPLLLDVLGWERRVHGDRHRDTLQAISNLGMLYVNKAQYDAAVPYFAEAYEGSRQVNGEEHPSTLLLANNLALAYGEQAKYAEALALFQHVADVRRRVLGEEHPYTLTTLHNMGELYRRQEMYDRAEPLFRKTLEARRRTLGELHPDTLASWSALARLCRAQKRNKEAEEILIRTLDSRRRVLGADHPTTLENLHGLGLVYRDEGRKVEAENTLQSALEARRRVRGPDHFETVASELALGQVKLDERKYAEAEPLLVQAYQSMVQRKLPLPRERAAIAETPQRIARLYAAWGKPDKAAEWRAKSR
ncbi:MAG: hypothetical protein C5B51_30755 [Terriglobia bacterium]|nr:MAG: hypothetical protein C5B51_30755 [Terriglobia bacterium]